MSEGKVTVRYTGHKAEFPILLPIGANRRSTIRKTIIASPTAELSEADAKALIELSPQHFELVEVKTEAKSKAAK
jgi:hypothetical protein